MAKFVITLTQTIPGENSIFFNDFQVDENTFEKIRNELWKSKSLWHKSGYIEKDTPTIWARLLPMMDELEYPKGDPFLLKVKKAVGLT
jgi:hypothetical protein